jgi:hypothetical protein
MPLSKMVGYVLLHVTSEAEARWPRRGLVVIATTKDDCSAKGLVIWLEN